MDKKIYSLEKPTTFAQNYLCGFHLRILMKVRTKIMHSEHENNLKFVCATPSYTKQKRKIQIRLLIKK
jgi:hypothetical protein